MLPCPVLLLNVMFWDFSCCKSTKMKTMVILEQKAPHLWHFLPEYLIKINESYRSLFLNLTNLQISSVC